MTADWPEMDREEMSVLNRFKQALIERHGWASEDFEGMSFLDVEAEYFDAGEAEFRGKDI